jgi:hypothetical protein
MASAAQAATQESADDIWSDVATLHYLKTIELPTDPKESVRVRKDVNGIVGWTRICTVWLWILGLADQYTVKSLNLMSETL